MTIGEDINVGASAPYGTGCNTGCGFNNNGCGCNNGCGFGSGVLSGSTGLVLILLAIIVLTIFIPRMGCGCGCGLRRRLWNLRLINSF